MSKVQFGTTIDERYDKAFNEMRTFVDDDGQEKTLTKAELLSLMIETIYPAKVIREGFGLKIELLPTTVDVRPDGTIYECPYRIIWNTKKGEK